MATTAVGIEELHSEDFMNSFQVHGTTKEGFLDVIVSTAILIIIHFNFLTKRHLYQSFRELYPIQ
jgi:hypothetical protein